MVLFAPPGPEVTTTPPASPSVIQVSVASNIVLILCPSGDNKYLIVFVCVYVQHLEVPSTRDQEDTSKPEPEVCVGLSALPTLIFLLQCFRY